MSRSASRSRGLSGGRPNSDDAPYEVGYCRPPKHAQFKPGKSGNPKGRSPQAQSLKTVVKTVFGEQMPVREGGRVRRMSAIEAWVRTMLARAFKGDPKAVNAVLAMMKQSGYGSEVVESAAEFLKGADRDDIIADFVARLSPDKETPPGPSVDPAECSSPPERGEEQS
jgi:hypothetical protein